jgi:hypothetical protein
LQTHDNLGNSALGRHGGKWKKVEGVLSGRGGGGSEKYDNDGLRRSVDGVGWGNWGCRQVRGPIFKMEESVAVLVDDVWCFLMDSCTFVNLFNISFDFVAASNIVES